MAGALPYGIGRAWPFSLGRVRELMFAALTVARTPAVAAMETRPAMIHRRAVMDI